jgi:hypothetical protein
MNSVTVIQDSATNIQFVIGRCVMSVSESLSSQIQGGSNMTGTNCDLLTHKSSRSYLNHLVNKNRLRVTCWGE